MRKSRSEKEAPWLGPEILRKLKMRDWQRDWASHFIKFRLGPQVPGLFIESPLSL
jgi:hypothetical protein